MPSFLSRDERAAFAEMIRRHFAWERWERLIEENGYTIDRPLHSVHPVHADIIYPIDYGYVNDTVATDGAEIDVFVGTGGAGLVGLIVTTDYRKGDQEFKLMYNCTPVEVYLVNGFINFNPLLMDGMLVLRRPMHTLW